MIGAPWTEHATLVPAAIVCMRDSERCVRIEEAARADMVRVEWRPIVRISSVSRILSSTMEEASVRTHALERLAAWDRGLCRRFNKRLAVHRIARAYDCREPAWQRRLLVRADGSDARVEFGKRLSRPFCT